ncbi:metal ABC transporter permease [Candidatus Aciduliprofundum boonei]|uniref:ABC-3 protein n=1 Tax=Aciduliprofundum boonei (strain DSM 19572 / T469) TaxID=439481 RepID=B5IER1_ACIB4|nr:metal ABC transporter permease [Candidatus Aciduliprofundum boonei]ADD07936.1 ABC-3 protein [Aciduliprofundum boonei T469]EDY35275.1 ABC 3 transport family [Aciduliprofundum boonei T469]HII55588.1 metal ABC transporter permease [Candidatus Aciduliprofundum boonei]
MFTIDVWLLRAIIAIFLIAIVSSLIGSYSVFRGSTFLVSGIAHGALAGAALGIFLALYLFSVNYLLVALIFSILFALAIGYASHKKENVDVSVGVMFALSMSLAILFLSLIREYASVAWGLIIGDLLLLSQTDIEIMTLSVIAIVLIFIIYHRRILFSIFDPEGAMAVGLKPALYESLLYVIVAIGVVVLLKGVGAILVYALLIIPAAASKRISSTVSITMLFAFLISLFSGLGGLALAVISPVSPSAYAGLIATSIYFLTIFKK